MNIQELVQKQRIFFEGNKTKNIKFRINLLKKLKKNIYNMQTEICEALQKDLGKSDTESYMSEIGMVFCEINHIIKNLKRWAKPDRVNNPFFNFSAKAYTTYEPYGVVLVISPWNYPFLLSIDPLVGAVCAGNCVVLKPSKESPNVGKILDKLIKATFAEEHVAVVQGSSSANATILEQKYDYIFFTGGSKVGKIVAAKAGETLTPVSLELGGKSPCIVSKDCNIKLACKRIAFGKYLNCGQTCIAPDYCLVEESIKDKFIECLKQTIASMYGSDPLNNINYGKIINKTQFDGLCKLLDEHVVYGGKFDAKELKIEPTILDNITTSHISMKEEIFGPILPILTFRTTEQVINTIKGYNKPLALYLFTNDKKMQNQILNNVSFGGGCINDTIMHIANTSLPFGGVGGSGMGKYHGKYSFLTFSNERSIVKKANWIDLPLRYQPYSKAKDKIIKMFMK